MNNPLILIVDNEPGILDLFCSLVQRLGYDVLLAEGGGEALRILEHETPQLMILDIAMPHITGLDVLHYVRQAPHRGDMRIMVLTATNLRPSHEIIDGLVDQWIMKPIHPTEFQQVVLALMEED